MSATQWLMTGAGEPLLERPFMPEAGAGEVVVKVAGCGVCHTDLGFYYDGVRTNHTLPLCLGHEISGHVAACGGGAEHWLGKPVIIPAVTPCGDCDVCRRGKQTICSRQIMPGNDCHGGFATHVVVPSSGLCPVDEDRLTAAGLDLAGACVVADAVTTPYQAVVQAGVAAGDLVIVNGVGGVGGYCAQIARAFGATVVAIDVDDAKLAAVPSAELRLNARHTASRELKGAIQTFAKSNGLREKSDWVIFECSGTRAGQEAAFGLLNRGATLAVVGFTMERVEIRLSNLMALHARALGNWGCPPALYPPALEMVLAGQVRIAPFIEKHAMAEINSVFDAVHRGAMIRRAVMVPSTESL
jgi:6-hydroxycyclohex-1-ene-1-carbonyl-CoA dehydrogenase